MSGIEVEGFDDLENTIQSMTLTDSDKTKAMKAAIKPMYDTTQNVTPVRSGALKQSEKMQVKKEDMATVGIVRYGKFWDIFNEFGTSKDKSHVGFFSRAIDQSSDEAVQILAKQLLDKAI